MLVLCIIQYIDKQTRGNNMNNKQAQARFQKLSELIHANAYQWPTGKRLNDWIAEFNNMLPMYPDAFEAYCEAGDFSPYHNGYDCLA